MRQNYCNKEFQQFTADNFVKLLETDKEAFIGLIKPFSLRVITITKANIGIDRRLLHTWKKNGLLPFRDRIDQDKKLWDRFSFIELCWLKVLIEFRGLGVGIENLKKIKEQLFPADYLNNALKQIDVKQAKEKLPNTISMVQENGLIQDDKFQRLENLDEFLEESQFSLFSILLYTTMLSRANQVLCVDKEGIPGILNLDAVTTDPISGIQKLYDILNHGAITTVNLKKIVADLSDTHEHFSKNLRIGQTISEKSIEILEEIFRKEGVKEVTIRVSDRGKIMVHLTKRMNIKEIKGELANLHSQGNFYDLIIKTRDGNVQYFEKTDLIRL